LIDAGPAAIPALKEIVERSRDEERRRLALNTIIFIGGPTAISIIRRELVRTRNDEFKGSLAIVLPSVDTVDSRRELTRILKEGSHEIQCAVALPIALLRIKDAAPLLQAVRDRDRCDLSEIDTALMWMKKGYWQVSPTPEGDRWAAIAAVLANGSPNLDEDAYLFDDDAHGFWKFRAGEWSFNPGEPDGSPNGPKVKAYVGSEGSRALVSVEMRCGRLCGTGYNFVLRKEKGTWKVQTVFLAWIA
jgi:hypothetical protein